MNKLLTLGIAMSIIASVGGITAINQVVMAQGIDRDNPICERGSMANLHAEDSTDSNNGNGATINECRG